MNQKQLEKWAKFRAKGKTRFILIDGVLKMGGIFALGVFLLTYFLDFGFTAPSANKSEVVRLAIKAIIGGILWGMWMAFFFWWWNEKEYRKSEQTKS